MTIAELKALIANLPDDMVVGSAGPDGGGYDAVSGYTIHTECRNGEFFIIHSEYHDPTEWLAD